ncbi:aminoacyl-tRNA deacylase [Endozoicomonas numazuensis]|uniref:aminoacyl-tRNA deacylase n=1 Tax=Endozoicomonas numazuensis TaxID=1137799 RepID=UPI0006909FCF|nr:YbaK/EbsC family protein [Endozoicomonas numazuensis]
MSIAPKIDRYLQTHNLSFDTISHPPSRSSVQSAIAAQIPLSNVAKAVILKDDTDNYLMAIVPASSRLQMKQMQEITDCQLKLASEKELSQHFRDCQKGAVPPIGEAYDMDMIWDNKLSLLPDVYIEAGDHETMIHLSKEAFQHILANHPHDDLCVTPHKDKDDL